MWTYLTGLEVGRAFDRREITLVEMSQLVDQARTEMNDEQHDEFMEGVLMPDTCQ